VRSPKNLGFIYVKDSSRVNRKRITQNDTFFKPVLKKSEGMTVKIIKIHYIRLDYQEVV